MIGQNIKSFSKKCFLVSFLKAKETGILGKAFHFLKKSISKKKDFLVDR